VNIEIHDPAIEARLCKQMENTASANIEEVLLYLLQTQEERDRWLSEVRETIDAKYRRASAELERGEGIPEDRVKDYLAELKAKPA
jgi:hypothetical protein